MEGLGAYVLSVAAGAVLCSIAVSLVGQKGTAAAIVRLVCGIIMASIVIRPLGEIIVTDLPNYYDELDAEVSAAVEAGTEQAIVMLSQSISEQTRAYILDKAAQLDLELEVEVFLSDDNIPVPVRVYLTGSASLAARSQLEQVIARDLGIGKEDQIWK